MTIGSQYMIVNGNRQLIDPDTKEPQKSNSQLITGGRTMVPVRAIVEAMSGTVNWNQSTQEVTMDRNEVFILMTIGQTAYYVNSTQQIMNVAPFLYNSRTFVPARFVAEAFVAGVDWDQASRTATITYFSIAATA